MSKIMITGNHKPRIASLEDGIVRRLQVIEFNHAIPENEQDPMLKHKLLKEKKTYSGVDGRRGEAVL